MTISQGHRRSGIDQVRLLVPLSLLLIVTACAMSSDRDARAYIVCVVRHAQDPLVCDALREAYRVDVSDIPPRAAVPVPPAGADTNGGRL